MGLLSFLQTSESILAVDIGSTMIKVLELSLDEEKPRVVSIASGALPADIFSGHAVTRTDLVSEELSNLLGANAISAKLGATALPGPSVFTKKIKMAAAEPEELATNIQLEAGNFIPHNIDAVKLDYHIIGESGKGQLDILVAAVKTEILESFVDSLSASGIESAVVDVDYFALQNAFELAYPELVEKTVALVNIGARYSAVNICKNGNSLFVGDVGVGGKSVTDGIAAEMNIGAKEAEEIKRKAYLSTDPNAAVQKQVDSMVVELNRQLSFFWNASGAEEGIDHVFICGGGAMLPGLAGALGKKTGIKTEMLDPFRNIDTSAVDAVQLKSLAPLMTVAVGLGIRQPGDKVMPEVEA